MNTSMLRGMRALALALVAVITIPVMAEGDANAAQDMVWEEARNAAKEGPQDIALADQAQLRLPQNTVFIPQPQATQLLNAMGNPGQDPRLQGLIFPKGGDAGWFMTVRYEKSGFIKDGDAKEWNADDLLTSYKEGTEAQNEERTKMGAAPLEILGWAETPAYDSASHRLVWAMKSREKGNANDTDLGVNYNTYLLGREGYFSMNLVTSLQDLPVHKPAAHAMLSALNFSEGKRYADFNESTDHVAEYGLAALVLGVGAKKLGLLAMAGVFLAKFAKLGFLALLGIGAVARKFFGGKKKADDLTPPPNA
ncbi:MAG: DUF2167 domain-containing protein [Vitreoscilla sp.]|nr:DUF2167 domain-containing protein [Vitreoscilla sp.]MBP6676926.1 DUF2167 domain-containing protein [Vitreoscilla sp.]